MSQSHPNDDAEISLHAGLLVTSTVSLPGKYGRIWRRFLFVGIFLSLRKTDPPSHSVISVHSDEEDTQAIEDDHQTSLHSIFKIVKERDLSSLKTHGGVERVASFLGSDLVTGINLPDQTLQLTNTRHVHKKGFLFNFLKAWNSPTILLLLLTAGLSLAVEFLEQGPQYGWHDGVAILVAVFLLLSFRSVSNFCLEKKLLKKQKFEVEVVRNGECKPVNVSDIVMGDLVHLKQGDTVPADGLFVNGNTLVLDEVLYSRTVSDENPFLSYGSKVTEGRGSMLVISNGATTGDPEKRTFLAAQIDKPNSYTEILVLLVSVLIAFVVLIGLLCSRQHKNDNILPELKGNTTIDVVIKIFEDMFWRPKGRVHILAGSVTAIVIGLQHGMPYVITVSLSFWNDKVELCGAKPQNLSACGTMGIVTVICVNATGGLIQMEEVKDFFIGEEDMFHNVDSESNQVVLEALRQGIGVSRLVPEMAVSPTNDLAVAAWTNSRWGIDMELSGQCFSVLDHGRLRTNINCSRVLVKKNEDHDEILHLHLKGDASTILNLCSHYCNRFGEVHPIKNQRRNLEQMVTNIERRGHKAIAFACKQVETSECIEEGSVLLAVVGLKNSAHETVQQLRNAGVSIKLVSQDDISAVRQIVTELEIFPPSSNYVELEGEQIRDLNHHERSKRIEEANVLGSCTTEDMFLVVKSLQEKGHVVAFFGGLTRETLALKEADLGIIKETHSTETTQKSSDIVILSDEYSLVQVMKFGRCAYTNIQKFTQLQLAACISGLSINLITATCLWDSPLSPIQLIWINFVTCLLGGVMMTMELNSENLMVNPLGKRTQPLITKAIWIKIGAQVLSQTCILMVLGIIPRIKEETWKPLVFNSFMLIQVLNQFISMGMLRKETAKSILEQRWFVLGVLCVMIMQVIVVMLGNSLGGLRSLNMVDWVLSLIIAALSWGLAIALEFVAICFSNWSSGWDHLGF